MFSGYGGYVDPDEQASSTWSNFPNSEPISLAHSVYIEKVKKLENELLKLIDNPPSCTDPRWRAIAKTHFQEGRMALVRSMFP